MNFVLAVVFLLLLALAEGREHPDASISERYEKWMARHGRAYIDAAEKIKRFEIFKRNVMHIDSVNNADDRPYKLAVNEFADLSNDEFHTSRLGYIAKTPRNGSTFRYNDVTSGRVPRSVDWRRKGAVTEVKNQGECGCCWAFSAVAAVEGIHKIATGKLVSLSEQELVDCDTEYNAGCDGGLMDNAFQFIIRSHGLTTETNCPYQGTSKTCIKPRKSSIVAHISDYENVPPNSESSLLKAVANQPVSVAIDAGSLDFQFYSSGVFAGDCGTDLNHGVTVVGFGETDNGIKYWIVKNSWGTSWGDGGYIKMMRKINSPYGQCGIAMQASYPTP